MDQQELYRLAVSFIKRIGVINAKKLISIFNSPESLFKSSYKDLKTKLVASGINSMTLYNNLQVALEKADHELKYIYSNNLKFLTFFDDAYPKRLLNCPDSPLVFYYSGENTFNSQKVIAIVGTRNATAYGKDFCKRFISDLSFKYPDAVVLSGLAYGIDICAHKEALKNNLITWAVLGHSFELIYPAAHRDIARKIVDSGGALISDFPSGSIIDPSNFVKRNRIVAGMCDALIVVESGAKGGGLITANIANHYQREVFAVPGNLGSKYSKGCNMLVKTNRAKLIESLEDLEYIMQWKTPNNAEVQKEFEIEWELTEEEKKILDILTNYEFLDIDSLVRQSDIEANLISYILLELEMKGVLKSLPGKVFTLKNK